MVKFKKNTVADHLKKGQAGEQLARLYLEGKGYQILEQNWRYSKAEIDLIAKDGAVLVFVEVKTRTSEAFGKPEEFVDEKKQALLARAANVYMEQINHEWEIRFDVIGILWDGQHQEAAIRHIPDAFFPGLA